MQFDRNTTNKNKEKIKKIVEFSKDRYPFVMKEVDGKAVVISQDKNKKNYISAYGEDGKLINEKSLPLDLYSNDYMFYYENICINNKYLILFTNSDNNDKIIFNKGSGIWH